MGIRARFELLPRRLAVISICLGLLFGCGDDDGDPIPGAESATREGWSSFERGELETARAQFLSALTDDPGHGDAHSGLGWTEMRRGEFQDALEALDRARTLSPTSMSEVVAGLSLASLAVDPPDFTAAGSWGYTLLDIDPTFAFAHDAEIDWRDVRLGIAQSHIARAEHWQAAAQVDSLGGEAPDPESPDYVRDLLLEIERLGNEIR